MCGFLGFSQITFNACPDNLTISEDNTANYTLNLAGNIMDGDIERHTYESTGYPDCPSGVCKVRIIWNNSNTRWEIQLDNGNGTYDFILYYNTTASYPNPPGLTLGVWEENTSVTGTTCGGALTSGNSVLTGSVQDDVTLSTVELQQKAVAVYPNPALKFFNITVSQNIKVKTISLFNVLGKRVLVTNKHNQISVEHLNQGMYFVVINTDKGQITKKIIID